MLRALPYLAIVMLIEPLMAMAEPPQPPTTPQLPPQQRCDSLNPRGSATLHDTDSMAGIFIAWIAAKTGLQAPALPRIAFVPEDCIIYALDKARRAVRTPHNDDDTSLEPACSVQSGVLAFYQCYPSTIFLPDTWSADDLRSQSILLHELVHHVQRYNKIRPPCPAASERQAYELQADWLRERGIESPYELIGTDLFTVLVLTACMPPEW